MFRLTIIFKIQPNVNLHLEDKIFHDLGKRKKTNLK